MRETRISLLQLALFGATRGMLGMGLGLLVAERLPRDRRMAVGTALFVIGAVSTIPLAAAFLRPRRAKVTDGHSRGVPDEGLIAD